MDLGGADIFLLGLHSLQYIQILFWTAERAFRNKTQNVEDRCPLRSYVGLGVTHAAYVRPRELFVDNNELTLYKILLLFSRQANEIAVPAQSEHQNSSRFQYTVKLVQPRPLQILWQMSENRSGVAKIE